MSRLRQHAAFIESGKIRAKLNSLRKCAGFATSPWMQFRNVVIQSLDLRASQLCLKINPILLHELDATASAVRFALEVHRPSWERSQTAWCFSQTDTVLT